MITSQPSGISPNDSADRYPSGAKIIWSDGVELTLLDVVHSTEYLQLSTHARDDQVVFQFLNPSIVCSS